MTRLPSALLVAAMLRRTSDGGGFGVVRARGDSDSGTILIVAIEHGRTRVLERGIGANGRPAMIESGPSDPAGDIEDYWKRRRQLDPDLWVIELDIPSAERLVAETILDD